MAEKNNGPNWESIKMEYVSTDVSMRKLAEKHGVSFDALGKRARRERWTDLRKEAIHKATTKAIQKAADHRARMMAKSMDVGYGLMQKVREIANAAEKMTSTKKRSETVTAKHIEGLNIDVPVRAISETDLVRLSLMYSGLMRTLGFDEASQIARERLEVDRLKVEMKVDPDLDRDERPIIIDERPPAEEDDA